jgi:hypothetical protein
MTADPLPPDPQTPKPPTDIRLTAIPLTDDLVRGAAELESTERGLLPHRLPRWAREQYPEERLLSMERQPSGIRLVFETAATGIELVTHPARIVYLGAERPRGRVDVYVDGALALSDVLDGGDRFEVDPQTGTSTSHVGPSHHTVLDGMPDRVKHVVIWLPHNESVELVELRADAPVAPSSKAGPLWVHHGSSISQGSNAASPSLIWPAIAARSAGLELRNLGFGGSAMVDQFVARTIRDAEADLISLKFGINVVNADLMRLRAFVPAVHGFLDTVRDGHPETPIVLVSPTYAGIHERTPGPGAFDPASFGSGQVRFIATGDPADVAQGRLTLEVIRRELRQIVERRGDANLSYVEGTDLYGEADAAELPLPDGLHPSPEAHERIGRRFAERVLGVLPNVPGGLSLLPPDDAGSAGSAPR